MKRSVLISEEELTEHCVSSNREEFLLDGIATFMKENYSDDITLDQLAEKACINKYKFSKLFNKRFGKSIKGYLGYIRVKKGAELLKNRDLKIVNIAFSVGYESVEHFIRSFKKIYGITPKTYRDNTTEVPQQSCYLWEID